MYLRLIEIIKIGVLNTNQAIFICLVPKKYKCDVCTAGISFTYKSNIAAIRVS